MTGINCIGFTSANIGLGIAARNTVRLLLEQGYPVSIADLLLDNGRSFQDHTFDHLRHRGGGALSHPMNLFHINPPQINALLKNPPSWLALEGRLNVCVPFWEQTVLPLSWAPALEAMDVVLCPSRFIEQAVMASSRAPLPHVRHYPQTAFLPGAIRPDRAKFGLPERGVLFIVSFETGSDCSRKNPWGAIDAFNRAFAPGGDAYLIVKVQNLSAGHEPLLARLRESAAGNDRIIIDDRSLGYDEVLSLYASCDCLVSLHRSEGFGLSPMEAMLLGKPVIATAWSGNMDFMDRDNSCLVDYRLVPVESPVYRELTGGLAMQWADPDPAGAAAWMRQLSENAALRERIGIRARQDMVDRQETCKRMDVFKKLEEMLFRKEHRAAMRKAVGSPPLSPAYDDQSGFFAAISALLKTDETTRALDLYYRERDSFRETPEMMKIDDIMRQVREMKMDLFR
jgi:glycosyltransferase involved in cell wall biosynthesis